MHCYRDRSHTRSRSSRTVLSSLKNQLEQRAKTPSYFQPRLGRYSDELQSLKESRSGKIRVQSPIYGGLSSRPSSRVMTDSLNSCTRDQFSSLIRKCHSLYKQARSLNLETFLEKCFDFYPGSSWSEARQRRTELPTNLGDTVCPLFTPVTNRDQARSTQCLKNASSTDFETLPIFSTKSRLFLGNGNLLDEIAVPRCSDEGVSRNRNYTSAKELISRKFSKQSNTGNLKQWKTYWDISALTGDVTSKGPQQNYSVSASKDTSKRRGASGDIDYRILRSHGITSSKKGILQTSKKMRNETKKSVRFISPTTHASASQDRVRSKKVPHSSTKLKNKNSIVHHDEKQLSRHQNSSLNLESSRIHKTRRKTTSPGHNLSSLRVKASMLNRRPTALKVKLAYPSLRKSRKTSNKKVRSFEKQARGTNRLPRKVSSKSSAPKKTKVSNHRRTVRSKSKMNSPATRTMVRSKVLVPRQHLEKEISTTSQTGNFQISTTSQTRNSRQSETHLLTSNLVAPPPASTKELKLTVPETKQNQTVDYSTISYAKIQSLPLEFQNCLQTYNMLLAFPRSCPTSSLGRTCAEATNVSRDDEKGYPLSELILHIEDAEVQVQVPVTTGSPPRKRRRRVIVPGHRPVTRSMTLAGTGFLVPGLPY